MEEAQKAYDAKYGPIRRLRRQADPDLADPAAMKIAGRPVRQQLFGLPRRERPRRQGFPNLTDDDWLYGGEPDQLIETITNGRPAVEGGTKMPAWGSVLGARACRKWPTTS